MSVNIFDLGYYASVNLDLAQNGVTTSEQLSTHFFSSGLNEGRTFSPCVDLKFYRSSYPDLEQNGVNTSRAAFDHLQNSGVAEGRRFSPFVDLLLLRRGSVISTEAGTSGVGSGGNGGNITIDADTGFVAAVLQENSDIIANWVMM